MTEQITTGRELDVHYYYVAEDRTLDSGQRILQYALTPSLGTKAQADAALAELQSTYPGARVYRATLPCDNASERDAAMANIQ